MQAVGWIQNYYMLMIDYLRLGRKAMQIINIYDYILGQYYLIKFKATYSCNAYTLPKTLRSSIFSKALNYVSVY